MKLLIDGDIVVYACGFASDTRTYICPSGAEFKYKKDAVAHCAEGGDDKELIRKEVTHAEPEDCVRRMHRFIRDLRETCDVAMDYEIYLSGDKNFREKVAVTHPYKGNRDDADRPHHYQLLRDFLVDELGAIIVDGMEADDAMGIAQCTAAGGLEPCDETCIVTIDKDLNMIPGWHYNWRKDDMFFVTEKQAGYHFHKQMLMGDRTDNIFGITKVGEVTATKMLKGLNWDDRAYVIKQAYDKEFGVENGLTRYNENWHLLWILREERT